MNKRLLQTSLSDGHLIFLAGTIWIVVIAASFVWNWHQVEDSMMLLVENASQSSSSGKQRTRVAIVHVLIGSLGLVGLEIGRRLYGSSVRKLRENESLVRALYESAQDAVVVMDTGGRISYWNPAAGHIFGYTNDEAIGQNLHSLLAPSHYKMDYDPALLKFQHSGRGDAIGKTLELKALRKGGEEFPMELSLSAVQLKDGWHAVGIIRDITERHKVEKALRESEAKFKAYMEKAPLGVFVVDNTGRYVEVNPAACQMAGYTKEELLDLAIPDFLVPEFLDKGMELFKKLKTEGYANDDFIVRKKNGEQFWINLVAVTIADNRIIAFCQDITENKQAKEKIWHMAYHDSLTGLPNRKLFSDRVGIALAQAERNQNNVAFIMLDFDNFKSANDTLGHDAGDFLLKTAAERLNAAMRKSDTVARFGGDEFVLLVPELKSIEDATRVAQKIVDSFRKPFLINTQQLIMTASIGVAVYPDDGSDEAALLKNADISMYQAKQAGRDRYKVFKKS